MHLGIQIFRFYFKCTKCLAELTFKMAPQNIDYVVESGGSHNFELWQEEEELTEREKWKGEAEELGDAMKSFENRALDLKMGMDILVALEEMRFMKSRHATVRSDLVLETLRHSAEAVGNNDIQTDASRVIGNHTDSLTTESISNNLISEETPRTSGAPRLKSMRQASSVIAFVAKKPCIAPTGSKQLRRAKKTRLQVPKFALYSLHPCAGIMRATTSDSRILSVVVYSRDPCVTSTEST